MADGQENGAAANVRVNHELVRILEAALGDARAGRIIGGGVVGVLGPSQFVAFSAFWTVPGEVIAGAELMKADILAKMMRPRSPIVRAGPAVEVGRH